VLFLAIGLAILSRHAPWAERLKLRLKARYPKAGEIFTRAEIAAERWMHKFSRRFRRS
jgi:hypothetical protein